MSEASDALRVPAAELRWRCDPASFEFATTAELEPIRRIVGQDAAVESLRFGLETDAPGQHVFVRGLAGTGRLTLVQHMLDIVEPIERPAPDRAFVHNFEQPDRPRLLSLPRGRGGELRAGLEALCDFVAHKLAAALEDPLVRTKRSALEARFEAETRAISEPFDRELRAEELALVTTQVHGALAASILPLCQGKPVSPEELAEAVHTGQIEPAAAEALAEKVRASLARLEEVGLALQAVGARRAEALRELHAEAARAALEHQLADLRASFPSAEVQAYLDEVVKDVVLRRLEQLGEPAGFLALYEPNLVSSQPAGAPPPIVLENVPTLGRLIGMLDPRVDQQGEPGPMHLAVHTGSLLRADGGYLILEAREVLAQPAAWAALMRTLRSGQLDVVSPELLESRRGPTVKPQAIPVEVKVVLLGDGLLYAALDALDSDFPQLFKVLADFDATIPRDAAGLKYYAGVLARASQDEGLLPFERGAVAALCEHGARIAAQAGKLTARFGRLFDLAREGSFLARKAARRTVAAEDVERAVLRSKARASLPSRKFLEHVARGTIRIAAEGAAVGQVNGLAVIHAGPLCYGFPSRITATIGAGRQGTINIEREAELSGSIHTKGFYILGGLLRHLLRTEHPLSFDASIAFEQSYGGIDGDSASGAEICCLLSALAEVPLRQDLAMTGAIDQLGNVLPVGSVNEKIEGFFDTCSVLGLSGTQGVIIPRVNVGDLMLRKDVAGAAAEGRFHVFGVETVHEALALFTRREPGQLGSSGHYGPSSVLALAVDRARALWEAVSRGSRPRAD